MSGLRRKHKAVDGSSKASYKKAKKAVDLAWSGDHDDNDNDEDIPSDVEEDERLAHTDRVDEDEEEEETVDAKRVRLARQYLQKLEAAESSSSDDEEEGQERDMAMRDRIGRKIQRERFKREGILERAVAKYVANDLCWMNRQIEKTTVEMPAEQQAREWASIGKVSLFRGHDLTPTCVALQPSGERALSGSKDNSVILWDVEQGKRLSYVCPSWRKSDAGSERGNGEALSVACSDDGRYAVVGRRDATVQIFDIRLSSKRTEASLVKSFKGHKRAVTSLCFRTHSNQLFSGSEDRCIRHYNLDEMAYLETLYGHQSAVTAIDCHRRERPISVSMDRTARAWKVAEDTHLIFRGGSKLSWADCITCLKDDWFVTGHADGNLCLWFTEKKKAVDAIDLAHGKDESGLTGKGIVSIGVLKGSDMVATGSNDGYLRLWKAMTGPSTEERGLESLQQIPIHGFINSIAVGPKARFCVVAIGQEPRLGRWTRVARAKNRFGIVRLRRDDVGYDSDGDSPEVVENVGGFEDEIEGEGEPSDESDSTSE